MQYNIYGEFSSCIIEPFATTATCPPNYSPAVNDTNKCCKNNLANYSTQYFTQSKTCQHCLLSQNLINEKCNPDNISVTSYERVSTPITGSNAPFSTVSGTEAGGYNKDFTEVESYGGVTSIIESDAPSEKKKNGNCPNSSDHKTGDRCYKVNECGPDSVYSDRKCRKSVCSGKGTINNLQCKFNSQSDCNNGDEFNSSNKKCYKKSSCPDKDKGYDFINYKCYRKNCPNGDDSKNDTQCYSNNCPNGDYHNQKCFSKTCPVGTIYKDKRCYSTNCPPGSVYKDTKCYSTNCPNGIFNGESMTCQSCNNNDYYDGKKCIKCPLGMMRDASNAKKCIFDNFETNIQSKIGADATIYNAINKA